jgi:hypothetical protein
MQCRYRAVQWGCTESSKYKIQEHCVDCHSQDLRLTGDGDSVQWISSGENEIILEKIDLSHLSAHSGSTGTGTKT